MFKRFLKRVTNSVVNNAVNTVVNNVNREVSHKINEKMSDLSNNIKATSDIGNDIIKESNETMDKLNGSLELEYCKNLLSKYREPLLMNINLDDYEDLYLDGVYDNKYDFFRSLCLKNEKIQGYEEWGNNYYKTKSNTFLIVDNDKTLKGNYLSLNLEGDFAYEAYHMTYLINNDIYSVYFSGHHYDTPLYYKNAIISKDKEILDNLIERDRYRNIFFLHLLDSFEYPDKDSIRMKKFNDDYYLFNFIVDDDCNVICLMDKNGVLKEINYFKDGIDYYFMDTEYQAKFSIRMKNVVSEANYLDFKNFNCID